MNKTLYGVSTCDSQSAFGNRMMASGTSNKNVYEYQSKRKPECYSTKATKKIFDFDMFKDDEDDDYAVSQPAKAKGARFVPQSPSNF